MPVSVMGYCSKGVSVAKVTTHPSLLTPYLEDIKMGYSFLVLDFSPIVNSSLKHSRLAVLSLELLM